MHVSMQPPHVRVTSTTRRRDNSAAELAFGLGDCNDNDSCSRKLLQSRSRNVRSHQSTLNHSDEPRTPNKSRAGRVAFNTISAAHRTEVGCRFSTVFPLACESPFSPVRAPGTAQLEDPRPRTVAAKFRSARTTALGLAGSNAGRRTFCRAGDCTRLTASTTALFASPRPRSWPHWQHARFG